MKVNIKYIIIIKYNYEIQTGGSQVGPNFVRLSKDLKTGFFQFSIFRSFSFTLSAEERNRTETKCPVGDARTKSQLVFLLDITLFLLAWTERSRGGRALSLPHSP